MRNRVARTFYDIAKPLVGFISILFVWYLAHNLRLLEPTLFPSPKNVFISLFDLFNSGSIFIDLSNTILRMFIGYGLAIIIGVLFGLVIGFFIPLYQSSEGVIDFFRSIPVTTLYPVFVLLFGIGHFAKIAMVFWASFFVIVLNTAYGVKQSNNLRGILAKLYGASTTQVFRWVIFYDALPQTLIGMRVALSFALIVEVLCEMFMGSEFGVGQRITESFTTYAISELYALILLSGIVGYFFNTLFVFLEKKFVPWIGK